MMLGLLLARMGVDVVVLEKHADFLRDFRGDTIHPSTLEVMHELGLLEELLRLPHQEMPALSVRIGDATLPVADFAHLPTRCRFVAFMPQWDFLSFLAGHAARHPTFSLRMRAEAIRLIEEAGRVAGVVAAPSVAVVAGAVALMSVALMSVGAAVVSVVVVSVEAVASFFSPHATTRRATPATIEAAFTFCSISPMF